ncbi:hypothetical protein TNIN_228661 [Trichonephila inaurata madagascariensis]|uniref:Uncharacterized protein n=1 Tax=Trichonephila inaurata madagascariensis TaxID=2747483 RepID=A0A8X6YLW2_9ARAC|nr:hypothetical protein TNIN_228661 [Trichonephila inaurata madagascariensis]
MGVFFCCNTQFGSPKSSSKTNSTWPLKERFRESKESLQQGRTNPYHLRPRNKVTKEAGSRPSEEESWKSKRDQSGPAENYLRGQARTIRVDTPASSPDNKVANSRSRVKVMEDPVIAFPDKVDTPDSKIARRLMEVQRVGGPHHLKSILEMSRKDERSFSQVVLFH